MAHPWMRLARSLFRPPARRPARFLPRLTALEDRIVPNGYVVNTNGDTGSGSGDLGDLRYCIAQANAHSGDDTVYFGGNFTVPLNPALGALNLTDTTGVTTLIGAGEAGVSGGDLLQLFQVGPGATAVLRNLTLTHAAGGAVINDGTLTVDGCTFAANAGRYGGAIHNAGTLTVTGSTFTGNTATDGGALWNQATLTVTGSTFRDNAATFGGGIYNQGPRLTVTTSTFTGNTAAARDFGGGALYNAATGAAAILVDCTLSGNASRGAGGGIYVAGGALALTNCTLTANRADSQDDGGPGAATGGGVYLAAGTVTLTDTIVAGNAGAAPRRRPTTSRAWRWTPPAPAT